MINRLIIISLTLVVFILSCKKQGQLVEPDITNGDVEFTITGIYRSQTFAIQAGINGYYMFSDVYVQPSQSFFTFQSDLKKLNCSGNCPSSLSIFLSSYNNDTNVGRFNDSLMFNTSRNFNFTIDSISSLGFQTTNEIYVDFVNNSGVELSSRFMTTNEGNLSNFTITNVTEFDVNANGQKTKKVDFQLFCYVKDTTGGVTDSLYFDGAFGFAYPSP